MLLDDVFDKLDQDRVSLIMQLVERDHFGQIFFLTHIKNAHWLHSLPLNSVIHFLNFDGFCTLALMNVKNRFLVLFYSFVLSQCSAVNEKEITLLKGYWEIEYVQAHGEKFQPRGNAPAVDYYFLTSDSTGVKKSSAPYCWLL